MKYTELLKIKGTIVQHNIGRLFWFDFRLSFTLENIYLQLNLDRSVIYIELPYLQV